MPFWLKGGVAWDRLRGNMLWGFGWVWLGYVGELDSGNLHDWQTCIRQTGIGKLALGKISKYPFLVLHEYRFTKAFYRLKNTPHKSKFLLTRVDPLVIEHYLY